MKTTVLHTESKTILADLQTPVSIYLKVRDVFPESVLLESSDYHGNENSVSFIGLNPMARFEVKNSAVRLQYPDGQVVEKTVSADAIVDELHHFVHSFDVGAG